MKKQPPIQKEETELKDRIIQLVMVADTFLKYTEQISSYYDEITDEFGKNDFSKIKTRYFLVLQQRLFFQESVLMTCSLFQKPGKTPEISFESYKKIVSESSFIDEITSLSDEFKNEKLFFSFRDKLLAHKDMNQKIDQTGMYWNPIEKSIIIKLRYFIDNINKIIHKYWQDTISMNYFSDFYNVSFDRFFGIMKQDIKYEIRKLRGEL